MRSVWIGSCTCTQVEDLQVTLKEELVIVEEKKATTQALIENIGMEKAVVDEAVETSRGDEEEAAKLQAWSPHGIHLINI